VHVVRLALNAKWDWRLYNQVDNMFLIAPNSCSMMYEYWACTISQLAHHIFQILTLCGFMLIAWASMWLTLPCVSRPPFHSFGPAK
jgi:hypothetical protein